MALPNSASPLSQSPSTKTPTPATPVAAIDIGSNSVRLVINDGTTDLVRKAVVTRLGRSMDSATSTELSETALEETYACFAMYADDLHSYGVKRCDIFATAAARNATNRNVLADGAERILGHRMRILTGVEDRNWRGWVLHRGRNLEPRRLGSPLMTS